ncbi:hypothetical protein P7K49_005045 [Saguinus oedipus]|uniref:Uncharacterized protein n=1 Tax=Saguinus oedipus TaxID=9490 RepID=A0ABQ9W962_SAGOE|nr:hypothetical protein P7K49_005045 [Saguinus oedipus]
MEQVKEETSYMLESNQKGPKQDRIAEGQALSEARKHFKKETQLQLDVEKELEMQISMKQEILRQAQRSCKSAELDKQLFKQDFEDKINSLQLKVEELTRQWNQLELELKQEKER